jgi:hypothetical protein
MITHEQILDKYGLKDGKDEIRLQEARRMAGLQDVSVETCFTILLDLEKRGLIAIENKQ